MDFSSSNTIVNTVKEMISINQYEVKDIKLGDSTIHLYGRKNDGIGLKQLEKSLLKMWPLFEIQFSKKPSEFAIVDFDAPMGGGPLEENIIGLFYSKQVSKAHQDLIKESTGWEPQSSTAAYISKNYSAFKNPNEAYVDDMLVHELGHLIFGWGLTHAENDKKNDWWFSFGMGLIYDRIAWNQIYKTPSPLFDKVIATYTNHFSKNKNIDQRLINPDTTKDLEFRLQRLQTYGHGKALIFLKKVRESIGPENFDKTMNSFVSTNGQISSWDQFLKLFSSDQRKLISKLENDFVVR